MNVTEISPEIITLLLLITAFISLAVAYINLLNNYENLLIKFLKLASAYKINTHTALQGRRKSEEIRRGSRVRGFDP